MLVPGFGLTTNFNSVMTRFASPPMYNHKKQITEKNDSEVVLDKQILPASEPIPPKNVQTGSGLKKLEDTEEMEEEVDLSSSKIVSEEILKAFESPTVRIGEANYEPPSKKVKIEKSNKPLKKINKLKFV
jgi:hypothetical protein